MQEPMQSAFGLPLGCFWAVGFGPILNKNQARKNQAGKIKTNTIIPRKITPVDKKVILLSQRDKGFKAQREYKDRGLSTQIKQNRGRPRAQPRAGFWRPLRS